LLEKDLVIGVPCCGDESKNHGCRASLAQTVRGEAPVSL